VQRWLSQYGGLIESFDEHSSAKRIELFGAAYEALNHGIPAGHRVRRPLMLENPAATK